jgi:hypothetical protein
MQRITSNNQFNKAWAAMSKQNFHSLSKMMVAIIGLTFTLNVMGASKQVSGSKAGKQLTQSYTWHDGAREMVVWLNPQVVAEFNPGKSGEVAAKNADSNAKVLPIKRQQQGVRLWQMNNTSEVAVRGMSEKNSTGKYSSVFHDDQNGRGAMRALPGNIIISLNPAWDATTVNNWFKTKQLEVLKKLEIGANIFIVKTTPGLEALNKANELYLSGEVVAAFPDWWQEVHHR